jgi:hypothetical protein
VALQEPPELVTLDLDEALELLAALQDSREILVRTDYLAVLAQVAYQLQLLEHKLGFEQGGWRV